MSFGTEKKRRDEEENGKVSSQENFHTALREGFAATVAHVLVPFVPSAIHPKVFVRVGQRRGTVPML